MTLVATIHTSHTIWMVTDRRLYYGPNNFRDDACKIMALETTDEVSLLGYAGLGATARGTQPSDWMSNVLRGQPGKIEELLDALGQAMERQLPPHLVKFPKGLPAAHIVLAPAYVEGKLNVYSIGVEVDRANNKTTRNLARYVRIIKPGVALPHGSCMAGSGASVLSKNIDKLTTIKKIAILHDRGKVSDLAVADELAKLNLFVHQNTKDNTVGPSCIVAWRYNKKGVHQGGGSHQFYTGNQRDAKSPSIPTIGNGMDLPAIFDLFTPDIQRWVDAEGKMPFTPDYQRIDTELQKLPTDPDERLR
jgi:hypothetical protein